MVQISELFAGERLVRHGQLDDYPDNDDEQSGDDAIEELE